MAENERNCFKFPAAVMGPLFYIDMELEGNPCYADLSVTDEEECQSKCLGDERCNFIAFKLEGKVCSLCGATFSLSQAHAADTRRVSEKLHKKAGNIRLIFSNTL